jgi:hypothetical protein
MKRSVFPACAATAALAVVLGVGACTTTTTPSHESSPSAEAKGSLKGVPFYQPSTVHSQTDSSATLSSPDPVTKVSNYYVNVVNSGGWTIVSKSLTEHSGNLTIKRSGQGATISVAPSGSGSLISISAYPTG